MSDGLVCQLVCHQCAARSGHSRHTPQREDFYGNNQHRNFIPATEREQFHKQVNPSLVRLVLSHASLVEMNKAILRPREMAAYVGLSLTTIYERGKPSSDEYDPSFPKRIKLGGKASGWLKSDADAWLESRKETGDAKATGNSVVKPVSSIGRKTPSSGARLARSARMSVEQFQDDLVPKLEFTEQFISSLRQAEYIKAVLKLPAWTPAMAALLVSGVKAPLGCMEIPESGEGIDGEAIAGPGDVRLQRARAIFKEWNDDLIEYDEDDEQIGTRPSPKELPIVEFFIWLDESGINTDWLRLILEVAGAPVPGSVKHIHASLAMQVSQSLTNAPAGSSADSGMNRPVHKAQDASKKRG